MKNSASKITCYTVAASFEVLFEVTHLFSDTPLHGHMVAILINAIDISLSMTVLNSRD